MITSIVDPSSVFVPLSAIVQMVFTAFAAVDALYFHYWKLRLHARADTFREHLLHTVNACLFPFTIAFLYCANTGGAALWVGVGATLLTFAAEFVDVGHEKTSRRAFGGVSAVEGVMHFGMGVARATAFALLIASKPVEAFSFSAPWVLASPYPDWVIWMGRTMLAASLPMAILHVALCFARREPLPPSPSPIPSPGDFAHGRS
jgi:hypothetical protein